MQILLDPIALEDMGSPDPSQDLDDAVSEAQADTDTPDGVTVDRVEGEDWYIGMGVTFNRMLVSELRNCGTAELRNGGGGLDALGVEGIEVVHTD